MEKWVKIKGFKYYEVSNLGNVRSIKRKYNPKTKKLKTFINKGGYLFCYPYSKGVKHTLLVHRVVSIAFIPNPKNKPCVNHKDGNKQNNRLNNLEWCTYKENNKHARQNGLSKLKGGDKPKLNQDIANSIRIEIKNSNISELARKYKVSRTSISKILNNKTYKTLC